MFTIKECTSDAACLTSVDEQTRALCEKFGAPVNVGDRVFVLSENGPRAVGVLGLHRGKVIVRGVFGNIDDAYRDLMVRALLNVCAFMQPITVRVENVDTYYRQFGFTEAGDGGMEVVSSSIRFH